MASVTIKRRNTAEALPKAPPPKPARVTGPGSRVIEPATSSPLYRTPDEQYEVEILRTSFGDGMASIEMLRLSDARIMRVTLSLHGLHGLIRCLLTDWVLRLQSLEDFYWKSIQTEFRERAKSRRSPGKSGGADGRRG